MVNKRDSLTVKKYKDSNNKIIALCVYYKHEDGLSMAELIMLIVNKHKYITTKDVYCLSTITVELSCRGKGYGSMLLRRLLDEAKEYNIAILCKVNPSREVDYLSLKAWYIRHGFIEINNRLWYNI